MLEFEAISFVTFEKDEMYRTEH